MKDALISSLRGGRVDPITGKAGADHGGLDFAVGTGTSVFASAPGIVSTAGFDDGGGNFIIVTHLDGNQTAYLHLSKLLVSRGQTVRAGDKIAESGNTGSRTTGPHLHYEVRGRNGVKLDPLDFLPYTFTVTKSLANQIGSTTVTGGKGLLGTLLLAGAVYGGYRYYKKKVR